MNYYTLNSETLRGRYNALNPDDVHRAWCHLLPLESGMACDIGAGTGRDAAWLASKGWGVIAVEPNPELRSLGEQFTSETSASAAVTWLDDQLPELEALCATKQHFDLILISAVWMHLPPRQHEQAMNIVSGLLNLGGLLVITLRHGPDEAERFYPANAENLVSLAQQKTLACRIFTRTPDLWRSEVEWDILTFQSSQSDDLRGTLTP